ncbi:MAG: glycine cleavage system aminomethyltransferase GcvT [Actinomycetota bacterium]|nr:glycine cleavage system aminomethyltransferase GcvT [Actinomycetota bacterium]
MTDGDVTSDGLRQGPLHAEHRALGARFAPFGGWEMPLSYPAGTLFEHRACRTGAAAFDVSHLGTVRVEGPGAHDRIQLALSADLDRIGPGRAQYTQLLDDEDGSVVDDLIVWWVDETTFDVMPNASNTAAVVEALGGRDVTAERAVVAVQGPHARELLAAIAPAAAAVPHFGVTRFSFQDHEATAAGTGYTGEDGVECAVPLPVAVPFWRALVGAGMTPAGLAARDTLRLEAALPLHGHELGPGITPLQAGPGWSVGWDVPEFRGRAALERERRHGVPRRLVGISTDGRQPPRRGSTVLRDGKPVGEVTSGNFSPVLGHGIALALVDTDGAPLAPGTPVELDLRGRRIAGLVSATPFVRRGTRA